MHLFYNFLVGNHYNIYSLYFIKYKTWKKLHIHEKLSDINSFFEGKKHPCVTLAWIF